MRLSLLMISAAAVAISTGCTMTETSSQKAQTAAPIPENSPVTSQPAPPVAARVDHEITQVGRTRNDPYNWMKDENWQEVMRDPSVLRQDIRDYLEAENAFTKAALEDPTTALREELFKEMRGRIKEDDSSVPEIDGPYAYYTRFREGGEYAIIARKPADKAFDDSAEETILLDGDALAEGKEYFSFGGIDTSPDHTLIAYATDTQGSEFYSIRLKNIESGDDLGVHIDNAYGPFEWSSDGKRIFWIHRDENARPDSVWQRDLETGEDTLVYREEDPGVFLSINKSASEEVIFISASSHTTSEIYWFPVDEADPTPRLIAARETDNEYNVAHWDDQFYILTNLDGAVDFKLMRAPMESTSRDDWEEVIPHRP